MEPVRHEGSDPAAIRTHHPVNSTMELHRLFSETGKTVLDAINVLSIVPKETIVASEFV